MANRKEIRNSTAEFLIFQIEGKEQGVEVYYRDKTVWCTQKAMGMLFDVNIPAISKHLKNIYEQGELTEERTVSKMEIVRMEGSRHLQNALTFLKTEKWLCNLRWHFPKLKNGFAKCAGISQN